MRSLAAGSLPALGLAASTIVEGSAAGTVVGGIVGSTSGSTLSLFDSAGGRFAISGSNLVAGATGTNFEAATSHSITIRETLAGAANTPRDTVFTITVQNVFEAPNLVALGFSSTSLTLGTASSGTITGATAGSTITASGLPTGLTINGPARTWAYDGTGTAGSATVTLTETLADSANSPRASNVAVTVGAALFPVSTPMIVEGDSNTAWTYMNFPNWMKRALAKAGGRFFIPVGGFYAQSGATVASASGAGANSMEGRRDAVVARITATIARFGRCILYFQIGTNGTTDSAGDIAVLANAVSAYKAAGAKVFCNLAPEFFSNAYRTALNAAIVNGTVPVDGYVNPTPVIIPSAGKTHYNEADNDAVGTLVANFLLARTTTNTIYTDPVAGFTIDTLAGTAGTVGAFGSGQLPTGWTATRPSGDGTAVFSVSGPDANGLYSMQIALTAGAQDTSIILTKAQALTVAAGDVVDAGATVSVISATDASSIALAYVGMGGGFFPKNSSSAIDPTNWAGPTVWRCYPVNQPGVASSVDKTVCLRVAAGKSATIEFKGFFHVIRDSSSTIAPVNTVAPVLAAASAGGTPSSNNGTWIGTPAPSFVQQFYLGETPIAASYVFQAGDVGQVLTCFVTATNSAGSVTASSNAVTVAAAPVATYAISGGGAVAEGNSGTTTFNFTVTRTNSTATAETLNWAVTGSGANPAAASDFVGGVLPSGTVTFPVGDSSEPITVSVLGDATVEPDETFTVTISAPSNGGTIATASAVGTITNDDGATAAPLWNATVNNAGTNIVYSGGNATAGRSNATSQLHLRGATAIPAGAKVQYVLQLACSTALTVNARIGVCDSTAGGATGGTNGTNNAFRTANGSELFSPNPTSATGQPTFASGTLVAVKVDRVANTIQISVNGGTTYGTARSIASLSGNLFAYAALMPDATATANLVPQSAWGSIALDTAGGFSALG